MNVRTTTKTLIHFKGNALTTQQIFFSVWTGYSAFILQQWSFHITYHILKHFVVVVFHSYMHSLALTLTLHTLLFFNVHHLLMYSILKIFNILLFKTKEFILNFCIINKKLHTLFITEYIIFLILLLYFFSFKQTLIYFTFDFNTYRTNFYTHLL